jgi:hypothetical protein
MFLAQIALWFGEDHGLTAPGRMDQTLRPFYEADLDAVKDQEVIFLPTDRNILKIVAGGIDHFYAKMEDWEYHPVEGWMGVLNPSSGAGLVFVIDGDALESFYTNNRTGTCGWFLDGGILDPGASFVASYLMVPVKGFHGFAHACRRLIADIQPTAVGGGVEVTHTLAGATSPLGDVTLKTSAYGVRSKKTFSLPETVISGVGLDPVEGKVMLNQPQEEPLVLRVEAEGKDWQESYETCFEGEFKTTIYPGYPYSPEYRRSREQR